MNPSALPADPSTIGTSTTTSATAYAFGRKTFYAASRYWAFYCDGSNVGWRSSADGSTWSSFNTIAAGSHGRRIVVFFDGTYVHYARITDTTADPMYYRRGTPNSDGSITWSAAEQTALAGQASIVWQFPYIIVDSNGYPWIGYRGYNGSVYTPYVTKSSTNDGTWTTETGFPYTLASAAGGWEVTVARMNSARMYITYGLNGYTLRGRLWTGTMGSEETATSTSIVWDHASTSIGDDVYAVIKAAATIIAVKRTYGVGWGSEETVHTAGRTPALSADPTAGEIYCFWTGDPTANHIYYKKRSSGGTWDASPTDWIDESATGGVPENAHPVHYQVYNNEICSLYLRGTASPYDVRHGILQVGVPPPAVKAIIFQMS